MISSGKGGVGKSTVAIGLAAAFCNSGKKTLLVDLDEGLRCLDTMLSVSDGLVFDLADALRQPDNADSAIYPVPGADGMWLTAAPQSVREIDGEALGEYAMRVSRNFDFVIFDCPAGIEPKYYSDAPEFTEHIIVCNTDKISVADAYQTANVLCARRAKLIINRFIKSRITKNFHSNIDSIIDETGMRLLGIVPEDKYVMYAASKGVPIEVGPAAAAFHRIAARICGMNVPLKI